MCSNFKSYKYKWHFKFFQSLPLYSLNDIICSNLVELDKELFKIKLVHFY